MAMPFAQLVVRDSLLCAAAAALLLAIYPGEAQAFSVVCGAVWACLNFFLLALLVVSLMQGKGGNRLFIFMLACAKIPASYYLLYWLYRVEYLEPIGLTAGITILPVVLLFRGLLYAKSAGGASEVSEEGR